LAFRWFWSEASLGFRDVSSTQEYERGKNIGLLCRLKHLNPFTLRLAGWDDPDLDVRKDVFILHGFAFIVLHADESKSIAAYCEILLRHISPIDETNHMKDDYVTPEIGGELERGAIKSYSITRLETPVVDALRCAVKQKNTSRRATRDDYFRLAEEDDVARYTIAICFPNVPRHGSKYLALWNLANNSV